MRKIVLGLSIVFMILISGCVTMSYDSKVNKNGEIAKYDMKIDTNSYMYSMLDEMCLEANGKSFEEYMKLQGVDYKEVWNKGNVTMTMKGDTKNASVVKNENFIIYREKFEQFADKDKGKSEEDFFGVDKAMDSAIQIHYYLEMPNKIIDSNADSVNDNKAEWHMLNSSSIRDVYAKCETPSSLPEMGLFNAIIILLIVVLMVKRNQKD